ncbi:MAG: hypothetical protein J5879_06085 [Clostridia bacterium]|nr:hypothetical protein [Clostridia bacterium]
MKKISVFIMLLAAAVMLTSCFDIFPTVTEAPDTTAAVPETTEPVTEAPDTTDEVTAAPEPDQTTEPATEPAATETEPEATTAAPDTQRQPDTALLEKFYKEHTGYWTNENGHFITFIKDEKGEYRVTFAVWNAGGPFPSGKATDIVQAENGMYYLAVTIDGLPDDPDWYGEGYEAYDISLPVLDKNGSERAISAIYCGEEDFDTFYYHTEPENPFLGKLTPEEEVIEEFVSSHVGYWSNEDGRFIQIKSTGKGGGTIFFAIWNAGGPFDFGHIKEVKNKGKGKYEILLAMDGVEPNDENSGWDPYEYTFYLEDLDGAPRGVSALHRYETEFKTFFYHTNAEYPFPL